MIFIFRKLPIYLKFIYAIARLSLKGLLGPLHSHKASGLVYKYLTSI